MTGDELANPGEVREDIPLRPSDSSGHRFGGLQLIIVSFALLSIAVTIALAVQIYKGDTEIVPHGSVATDSRECSTIGTDILKFGGNSIDAAVAAAFCLAVVNPHSTGLDATGTMIMYEYKRSKIYDSSNLPIVVDFSNYVKSDYPQLVKSLAFIHSRFGVLEWKDVIQPSIELARDGFNTPNTLVEAILTVGNQDLFKDSVPGKLMNLPLLASYLEKISNKNSSSLIPNDASTEIHVSEAIMFPIDDFNIYMPQNSQSKNLITFLNKMFLNTGKENQFSKVENVYRIAYNLNSTMETVLGQATSIAVIDQNEIYVSLITGLHSLLGSHATSSDGYILNKSPDDEFFKANKYTPLIITSLNTCGLRVVLSCSETAGAAQVIFGLLLDEESPNHLASAIESARFRKLNSQNITYEADHSPTFSESLIQTLHGLLSPIKTPQPYPTCNAVQQIVDSLSSHADSRGGGLASRF